MDNTVDSLDVKSTSGDVCCNDCMTPTFSEVFNRLDGDHIIGLNKFLKDACGLVDGAVFLDI